MDIFNTLTEKDIPISEENFTKKTLKEPPYYVKGKNKEHCYGICPRCDNPIQIIGLYKNTKESGRKPYGKHNKGDVPDLARYNEDDYENCPFANSNWKKPYPKRKINDKQTKEFIDFLKQNYDHVIAFIESKLHIYISMSLAEEMLREYIVSEAWLYRMARIDNIPWTLLDANKSHNLYGRFITRDCELLRVLRDNPKVSIEKGDANNDIWLVTKSGNEFTKITFFLCNHMIEHGHEKINFKVYVNEKRVYQETFIINSGEFKDFVKNNKSKKHSLNEKAQEIIKDLLGDF